MTGFKPEAFDCDNAAQNIFCFLQRKTSNCSTMFANLRLECSIKHTKICKDNLACSRLHLARELRKNGRSLIYFYWEVIAKLAGKLRLNCKFKIIPFLTCSRDLSRLECDMIFSSNSKKTSNLRILIWGEKTLHKILTLDNYLTATWNEQQSICDKKYPNRKKSYWLGRVIFS